MLTQTLWDAHPACLYRSAAPEIIGLLEYAALRAFGIPPDRTHDVRVDNLQWFIGTKPIVHIERPFHEQKEVIPVQPEDKSDVVHMEIKDTVDVPFSSSWKISYRIRVRTLRSHTAPKWLKTTIKYVLFCLLFDLQTRITGKLEDYQRDSSFGQSLDSVVAVAASKAKNAYLAQTASAKEDVRVQVMLYHPGEWSGQGKSGSGFLFYPSYDVSSYSEHDLSIKSFNLFHRREDHRKCDPTNATTVFSDDKSNPPLYELVMTKALFWITDTVNINQLYESFDGNGYQLAKSSLACELQQYKTIDNYATVFQRILTHPQDFLATDLLWRPLERTDINAESSDCQCAKPTCFQPRGHGIAGIVAETYSTFLVAEVEEELPLAFDQRSCCIPYVLMGMFEAPFGCTRGFSAIVTPLMGKGQLLGVLVAYKKKSENLCGFTQHDVEVFESIASRVGRMIQETKDYMFFWELVKKWNDHKDDPISRYREFVRQYGVMLPFIMNGKILDVYESVSVSDPSPGATSIQCGKHWSPGMADWESENVTLPTHIATKGHELGIVRFLRTSTDTDSKYYGIDNSVYLYIPAQKNPSTNEPLTHYYIVKIRVEEPKQIFSAHKDELEVFFNYCFAITGAIPQFGPHSQGGGDAGTDT